MDARNRATASERPAPGLRAALRRALAGEMELEIDRVVLDIPAGVAGDPALADAIARELRRRVAVAPARPLPPAHAEEA